MRRAFRCALGLEGHPRAEQAADTLRVRAGRTTEGSNGDYIQGLGSTAPP